MQLPWLLHVSCLFLYLLIAGGILLNKDDIYSTRLLSGEILVIFLAVVGMIFVNPSANRTQESKIGRVSEIIGYVVFILLILRGGRFIQMYYYLIDYGVQRVSLCIFNIRSMSSIRPICKCRCPPLHTSSPFNVHKSADLHTSPFLSYLWATSDAI
jgi:hypothetical protein